VKPRDQLPGPERDPEQTIDQVPDVADVGQRTPPIDARSATRTISRISKSGRLSLVSALIASPYGISTSIEERNFTLLRLVPAGKRTESS